MLEWMYFPLKTSHVPFVVVQLDGWFLMFQIDSIATRQFTVADVEWKPRIKKQSICGQTPHFRYFLVFFLIPTVDGRNPIPNHLRCKKKTL